MKSGEALRVLAELTAYQGGMVTSAQAGARGVSRLDLSRLAEAGHLERVAHGVYKDAGAPSDQFEDLRAAWISAEPRRTADVRLQDHEGGVVVAGASAARLHGIGDLAAHRHDFVSPARRQTQRSEIRFRQRRLDARDVTVVEGLPTMSVECTIADLFNAEADSSHVADALRDAASMHSLDVDRLRELLAPHAKSAGHRAGDGSALLDQLMETAGIGADTLAGRIASSQIGARVAARYLEQLGNLQTEALRNALPAFGPVASALFASSISPASVRQMRDAAQRAVLTPDMEHLIENAQKAFRRA